LEILSFIVGPSRGTINTPLLADVRPPRLYERWQRRQKSGLFAKLASSCMFGAKSEGMFLLNVDHLP